MAEMFVSICNREGGCITQCGNGKQSDIEGFASKQEYMQNNTEVRSTCKQTCAKLEKVLGDTALNKNILPLNPGEEIITSVLVSGTTRDGAVLDEAPGVAIRTVDSYRTELLKKYYR